LAHPGPGGRGDYGSPAMKAEISRVMSERNGDDFGLRQRKNTHGNSPEDYAPVAKAMGIRDVSEVHDDTGDWLVLRKAHSAQARL
jgi:hypothetical protein